MDEKIATTQKFDYHSKRKIALGFTLFTLAFYVASYCLALAVHKVTYLGVDPVDFMSMQYSGWSTFLSNLLSAIVCFYLILKLLKYHKAQPTIVKIVFMAYLLFSGLPALVVAMNAVMPPAIPDLEFFFSIAAFFLIPGSTFFLVYFVIEIFENDLNHGRNALMLFIIGIFCIVTYCISLLLAILGAGSTITGITSLSFIVIGFAFIVINLIYYFYLARKTLTLGARVSVMKQQRGLRFMGYGGIVIGLIYLFRIVLFIMDPTSMSIVTVIASSIVDFMYLLGYILLYLGVTIPMKKE